MIENTWATGPASGYVPPKPKGTEGVSAIEEENKLKNFDKEIESVKKD
jgi:hypothetical protein